MSIYGETYLLRAGKQEDGRDLLKQASVAGVVLPPVNGWVPIIPDGTLCAVNEPLVKACSGLILYLIYSQDTGWYVGVFMGGKEVGTYQCAWFPEFKSEFDKEPVDVILAKLFGMNANAMHSLFHPADAEMAMESPSQFMKLLGIQKFHWMTFTDAFDAAQSIHAITVDAKANNAAIPVTIYNKDTVNEQLLVPKALWGRYRNVKPKWIRIVKKALKTGSWDAALEGKEMIRVEDMPGNMILKGPDSFCQGDNLLLYVVGEELMHTALVGAYNEKRTSQEILHRELVLQGMNYFWFALGMLAGSCIPNKTDYEAEKPQVWRKILEGILNWWPHFCQIDEKIKYSGTPLEETESMPTWYFWVLLHYQEIGAPIEEIRKLKPVDPVLAIETLRQWLKKDWSSKAK